MPLRSLLRRARPRPSIRQWLLGASLLAVLGGYAALFATQSLLAVRERRAAHLQTLAALSELLPELTSTPAPAGRSSPVRPLLVAPTLLVWLERTDALPVVLSRLSPEFPLPQGRTPMGLLAELAAAAPFSERGRAVRMGGESYLFSVLPLSGARSRLLVLEAVSSRERHERTNALLLLAAAGSATLLTGLVLRPVLDRGLAPLNQLGARLERIQFDSLASERLPLEHQPRELLPIAQAFNALLDRLAASWSRQSAFVDGVAHELRTPITLINGYAQSLQRRGAVAGPSVRQLALIQSEAERMARMVTDLLDLARDDAGRLELERQRLDPERLLLEAYERLEQHAQGRLRLEPPGEGRPLEAWGDPHRLQQCLTNLVENALKYAPDVSPITLQASADSGVVRLHVRDRGPGVPAAERQRIFERFVRGSAGEGCSGSGLGLSVVRLLMERMGGGVDVAEAPGGGADFQLVLPVRSGSGPP